MGFEPQEWRLICPECGHTKIGKTPVGSFACVQCGCEFKHNWKAWILVGTPWFLLLAFLLTVFSTLSSLPDKYFYALLLVCIVAYFVSPDFYKVLKHGNPDQLSGNDNHDAPRC